MNLGKRIEERLNELEWGRSKLYELVPELSPAALSALIKRDSKRCELDVKIAKALGVHLAWLNSGEFPKLLTDFSKKPASYKVSTFPNPLLTELLNAASKLNDDGLRRLIERAEVLAERFPLELSTESAQ